MQEFQMICSVDHIILKYEGKNYIIDTGSPYSFSFVQENVLKLNGMTFNLKHGMIGVHRKDIENLVKTEVDGFIGLDILMKMGRIAFFWEEKIIIFGYTKGINHAVQLPISYDSFHVKTAIRINGQEIPMLVDTGARIDYLDSQYLDGKQPVKFDTDFNPYIGKMNVDGYECIYSFSGMDYPAIIYKMPSILRVMLGMLGVCGIIGMNIFQEVGKIFAMDFEKSQFIIGRED